MGESINAATLFSDSPRKPDPRGEYTLFIVLRFDVFKFVVFIV